MSEGPGGERPRPPDAPKGPGADDAAPRRVGPWTREGSRLLYENPWIRVREDAVTRPDGAPGIYGVVEFRNLAVGVVPLDADGGVTLVGQHRYPLDAYSWEIPEGGCPKGRETPEATAARELREETGLVAERWDFLGCMALSNSVSDEIAWLFLARGLTRHAPEPEPEEVLRLRELPFDAALREALEGRITDSMSCVALSRAADFLDRERRGLPPPEYPRPS